MDYREPLTDAPPSGVGEHLALDRWIESFSDIYFYTQNHERSVHQLHLRLFEAALNLQKSALKRRSLTECSEKWLPKMFAWYCALLKALRISGLSALVWRKFPGVCPFCASPSCECKSNETKGIVDRSALSAIAVRDKKLCPSSLGEWQEMFQRIYAQSTRGISLHHPRGTDGRRGLASNAFLKLFEELTELSEAIRLRPFYPDNLRNEVADVFATICGVANVLPTAFDGSTKINLGREVWRRYPGTCDTCRQRVCVCRHRGVSERLSSEGVREFERRDALTSLENREQYAIDRERCFSAPRDEVVAEMYFDCDNFKFFNNDTPGRHAQGDAVLVHVAQTATKHVGPYGKVFRLGGDEFSILFRCRDRQFILDGAQEVFSAIAQTPAPNISGGEAYSVSISAGLAFRSELMASPEDLSHHADDAQYKSKEAGKGRLTVSQSPS